MKRCSGKQHIYPLLILINQEMMKYFVCLNNKDNDSIVKQSFLMSKNLHSINNSRFYSNFMNMLEKYNSSDLDLETLDNDAVRQTESDMKKKYISYWRHSMQNSEILGFYRVFKDEYSPSDHLTHITKFSLNTTSSYYKVQDK